MQLVQQPPEELERIPDLYNLEPLPTRVRTLLQQLMRADLSLERLGVPHLPTQHREPPNELRRTGRRDARVEDEEVAEGDDVDESVEDGVHVRVGLDVVEADEAGVVGSLGQGEGGGDGGVDAGEEGGSEGGEEEILDVVQRRICYFVAVGKDVDL